MDRTEFRQTRGVGGTHTEDRSRTVSGGGAGPGPDRGTGSRRGGGGQRASQLISPAGQLTQSRVTSYRAMTSGVGAEPARRQAMWDALTLDT